MALPYSFGTASIAYRLLLKQLQSNFAALIGGTTGYAAVQLTPTTFANRPASPSHGMIAAFTDSNTVTWGATIAGGSTNKVIGAYNGTNWTVIGI